MDQFYCYKIILWKIKKLYYNIWRKKKKYFSLQNLILIIKAKKIYCLLIKREWLEWSFISKKFKCYKKGNRKKK